MAKSWISKYCVRLHNTLAFIRIRLSHGLQSQEILFTCLLFIKIVFKILTLPIINLQTDFLELRVLRAIKELNLIIIVCVLNES